MNKIYSILKEIGKFSTSWLCIWGISYITSAVVCGDFFTHSRCIKTSSSENFFECVTHLSSITCNPRKLILFSLTTLIVILCLFAKKKKISKSWVVYFLFLSIIYFLADLMINYVLSSTN